MKNVTILIFALLNGTAFSQVPHDSPNFEKHIFEYRDDRKAVENTKIYPFSAVCRIEVTFPNGESFVGTGTLVAPNLVLTAAHVVYDLERGGIATNCSVTPGYDKGSQPFGSSVSTNFWVPDDFQKDKYSTNDIALITIQEKLGNEAGWLGVRSTWFSKQWSPRLRYLLGFPGDKDASKVMYINMGNIEDALQKQYLYKFTTYNGMSGGPLFLGQNDEYFIDGVHSGHYLETEYNYSTRVTRTVIEEIGRNKNCISIYNSISSSPQVFYKMKNYDDLLYKLEAVVLSNISPKGETVYIQSCIRKGYTSGNSIFMDEIDWVPFKVYPGRNYRIEKNVGSNCEGSYILKEI